MKVLGKLADGTIDIVELYIWYIIVGALIASWSYFYLAAVASNRHIILLRVFGGVLALIVVWLGFVAAYDYSYEFADPIKFSSLIMPIVLLTAQVAICIIFVVYRRKKGKI